MTALPRARFGTRVALVNSEMEGPVAQIPSAPKEPSLPVITIPPLFPSHLQLSGLPGLSLLTSMLLLSTPSISLAARIHLSGPASPASSAFHLNERLQNLVCCTAFHEKLLCCYHHDAMLCPVKSVLIARKSTVSNPLCCLICQTIPVQISQQYH